MQRATVTETLFRPHERMGMHAHAGASLSIVMSGGYEEHCGSRSIMVRPMMAVFKPAALEHDNIMGAEGMRGLWIELPADAVYDTPCMQPRVVQDARFRFRIAELRLALPAALHATLLAEDLVATLLADLRGDRDSRAAVNCRMWLQRVRDRLHAEFRSPPTLLELARDVDVHPVYLAQTFRQCYAVTIGEYVRRLRVEHAAAALEHALPLSQVALEAGFADQSHLTRVFRAFVGTTPRRYRNLVTRA